MIDVPVQVKDALKEGAYKKNYRMEVSHYEGGASYMNITEFVGDFEGDAGESVTLHDDGTYYFYCPDNPQAFRRVLIDGWAHSCPEPEPTQTETNMALFIGAGTHSILFYGIVEGATIYMRCEVNPEKNRVYDFTIDNENLVSESVSIDERMCSGDTIKFGLCEGSSLEFQYFGKPNITGHEVQAFIDVDYEAYGTSYRNIDHLSDLGRFTIETAGEYRVFSPSNDFSDVDIIRSGAVIPVAVTTDESGTYADMQCKEGDVIEFVWQSGSNIDTYLQSVYTGTQIFTHPIPMGFFTVAKCSRQASTGIRKVTAYNKLRSSYLDAKANEFIQGEFDDDTQTITTFDVLDLLLGEYSINPYMEKSASYAGSGYFFNLDDGSATKFDTVVGNHGALNPKDFIDWTTATTGFNLYITTQGTGYTLDPTKYYKIDCLYDLDLFEESFYRYLKKVVTDARMHVDNSQSTTGSPTVAEAWMNNLITKSKGDIPSTTIRGWGFIFAIRLTKEDDTVEVYSEYTPNSTGTMRDLSKKLMTGYKRLDTVFPIEMGEYKTESGTTWFDKLLNFYGEDWEYNYFTNSQYDEATATYESFKYPDGSIIENGLMQDEYKFFHVNEIVDIDPIATTPMVISDIPDVTLRELQSAVFETQCQFGQLSRETDLFSGVELNHSRLLPQETLFPANNLYPGGAQTSAAKAMYSKLWADEGNVHKWRDLIITFKGLDEEQNEKEFTLTKVINMDGTDNYNMSNNWLFKNLIWTPEQVNVYAEAMKAKMKEITWFPFEMWCAGLPYVETGDEIEIPLGEESYTSYILQRQLKGIQNLQDTYINGTLDIF